MFVYLRTKFQVSSITLTSFRQVGGNFTPHTSKRIPKKPTEIRVNDLNENSNVNFMLLFVYLDHKNAKCFSLSRKYQ